MSETSDQYADLLARIALRDRTAFKAFYDATKTRTFALAVKMLGSSSEAEDVLQDVYLKVWHSADRYNANLGEPMAWLIALTRNKAIDKLRKRSSTTEKVLEESGIELDLPDGSDAKLNECVRRLEDNQRQSIFAAFFQGMTHTEIARRFAEPIGTIKSRVRRGLASLKACLES